MEINLTNMEANFDAKDKIIHKKDIQIIVIILIALKGKAHLNGENMQPNV